MASIVDRPGVKPDCCGRRRAASNARGYEKIDDFRPISCCISETVIVRRAHAARQFVSIEFSFHPYNI